MKDIYIDMKKISILMRTFNHIKDRQFPEGYPDVMQNAIDNLVGWFLNKIGERFDLNEIKTILDIGSLNGIESVKFTEKLPSPFFLFLTTFLGFFSTPVKLYG